MLWVRGTGLHLTSESIKQISPLGHAGPVGWSLDEGSVEGRLQRRRKPSVYALDGGHLPRLGTIIPVRVDPCDYGSCNVGRIALTRRGARPALEWVDALVQELERDDGESKGILFDTEPPRRR